MLYTIVKVQCVLWFSIAKIDIIPSDVKDWSITMDKEGL